MTNGIRVRMDSEIEITPKILASAFWEMSAQEQAEFFAELHDITEKGSTYGLGEMQWCYMSQEIEKNPKAKAQACSMMVWIFNRATDFLSRQPWY